MRIGMIAPPWLPVPPNRYGGTEAVIDLLAREFGRYGHEVLLWTTGDSTCPVRRGSLLAEHRWTEVGRVAIEAPHVVAAYEAMATWAPDVIHDHTISGPMYARSAACAPVVTTNHGPFDRLASTVYRAIGDDVAVVAISHDQASRAEGVPIAAVIHHGVDVDAIPVGAGCGDGDGQYVVFLGRMSPDKGVVEAIEAVRAVGQRLVIAAKMAEPEERCFFDREVRPRLGPAVRYVGEVGPAERARLLGGATALLNPIRWPEPFGLVMVEALACGTPVITTTAGSAPEIIDHGVTGFLCPDEDALLAGLVDAKKLERRACRAAAVDRFSGRRMATDHLRLYQRITAGAIAC